MLENKTHTHTHINICLFINKLKVNFFLFFFHKISFLYSILKHSPSPSNYGSYFLF